MDLPLLCTRSRVQFQSSPKCWCINGAELRTSLRKEGTSSKWLLSSDRWQPLMGVSSWLLIWYHIWRTLIWTIIWGILLRLKWINTLYLCIFVGVWRFFLSMLSLKSKKKRMFVVKICLAKYYSSMRKA